MEKAAQNIQDSFLNNARKEKTTITLYLLSGVKLSGRIRSFDKYCLVLETSNQEQLIFKHAISTVVLQRSYGGGTERSHHPGVQSGAAAHSAASPTSPAAAPKPETPEE